MEGGIKLSRGSRLSVLGLYQYDETIFSQMVYPSGFTMDDKNTTVGNILAECAELECIFPDTDTLKTMIGLWSKLNISVWERIFTASNLEYNPIENYNRTEIETTSHDRTDTHSGNDVNRTSGTDSQTSSATNTEAHTGTDTHTTSEAHTGTDTHTTSEAHTGTDTHTTSEGNSGKDTTVNKIVSYDSQSYYNHDQSEITYGHSKTGSDALQHGETVTGSDALQHGETVTGSDALAHGHSITDTGSGSTSTNYGKTETITHGEKIESESEITRENHTTGNIGVTTSQQMLEQEIEISAKLNVIKMIVDSFKTRFCILVY